MCEGEQKQRKGKRDTPNDTNHLQFLRETDRRGCGLGDVGGEIEPGTWEDLIQDDEETSGGGVITQQESKNRCESGYNPSAIVQWLREHRDVLYPR